MQVTESRHYGGDESATIVLDKTVDANICKQGYKKVSGPQLENSFKWLN